MVSSRNLLVFLILLTLWDPVNLFPKNCICHGRVCNCSWMSLQEVPSFQHNTEKIIASHNAIASINNGSFSTNYQNLISVINLDYNLLSHIDSCTFKGLSKLKTISLRHNVIEELPASVFVSIPNVVQILIQGNKIELLQPELFRSNSELKIVDISYNKLKNLSSQIFKQNQLLTEVYLNDNKISSLPSDIFQNNPNLRVVHLGNNKITSIQSTLFHSNRQLEYANFSNNEIVKFGNDAVQQNCPIERLDISGNKLEGHILCQIQCFEKPRNVLISDNLISCDDHLNDVCLTFKSNIASICDLKTSLTVSSRRKREEYPSSSTKSLVTSPWNEEKSSTNLKQNPVLLDRESNISESSTIKNILPISNITNLFTSDLIYYTYNENSSDVYNQTILNSTLSSEQMDFNLTTVVTILQYDSPLVLKESTMRGFIFIGIEFSLAGALVLKKLLCIKDKRNSTPVDTIELLSASEQATTQNTSSDDSETRPIRMN